MTPSPWVFSPRPRPSARVRLFCFHHAGVGASTYRTWPDHLPSEIEVCAIQLPGRESRLREAPFARMDHAAGEVLEALVAWCDRPYAIYGHSMGSLFAFEVARALPARVGRAPLGLMVSGRRAPHIRNAASPISGLPDAAFVEAVGRRYGGIPPEILQHADLMALLLPTLRADLRIVEGYVYVEGPPLTCPIAAYAGLQDVEASPRDVEAWRSYTTALFTHRLFAGGHFFFQPILPTFCAEIGAAILTWTRASR